MIKITVGNSQCQIVGFDAKTFILLRKALSYIPTSSKSYFSGRAYNRPKYLLDKRGSFPTGLLYLVKETLRKKSIKFTTVDSRVAPVKTERFKAKFPHTPYLEQMAAALACYLYKRGIVVAPTGVGKSLIVAMIINKLQTKTIVVVPRLELKRQLIETLRGVFGEDKVGALKDKRDIVVENVDTLEGKQTPGYDCVIVDEFHHAGAATYQKLNKKAWGNIYYKFGLTATPFRSDANERLLLESVLSRVILRVKYQDAVDKGYIVPVEAYYIDLPKIKAKEDNWQTAYKNLIVNNKDLNSTIAALFSLLKDQSVLCLVKEVKHGNNILDLLPADHSIVFANGQDGECQEFIKRFNAEEVKGLIGTVGVIGEGVDTKPAEWVLVAGGGKSKNAFMQWCGRGVRRHKQKESCKVILFRYNHNKWLKKHFAECVKYLRDEYGIEPVKLEI